MATKKHKQAGKYKSLMIDPATDDLVEAIATEKQWKKMTVASEAFRRMIATDPELASLRQPITTTP